MKVLLIHWYFWPDTSPYAEMLRVIAGRLARDGHQVRVLSAQPSYTSTAAGRAAPRREHMEGFEVLRTRLLKESKSNYLVRGINAVLWSWAVLRQAFTRGGWDTVMISTMPPVLPGMAARWCARLRGAAFLYHMMDIHPEAAAAGGMMRRGMLYRLLRAIDRRNCARARRVVVLSEDMAATLRARGLDGANVLQIDNFELRGAAAAESSPVAAPGAAARFTVLFAGNIGRFQALDGLLDAAHRLRDRGDLRFLFLGEGAGLARLQAAAARLPEGLVEFRGHVPVAEARAAMLAADLGVVALAPGVHRVAFPSKTMTYACEGLPMLALVETGSSLAQLIEEADLGVVADPADGGAIAAALSAAIEQGLEERQALRQRVREYGEQHYSRAVAEQAWSALYARLAASRRS